MGIESIGSAVSNFFVQKTETPPSAPAPAAPAPSDAVVPAQYQSGFESTPLTGAPGAQAAKLPPEVAQTFVEMNNKLADAFMKSGNYAAARSFNDASKSFVDKMGLKDASVDPLKNVDITPKGDVGPTFERKQLGFDEALKVKEAQINQAEKMSKAIGRPVDPQNVNDVKAYFDTISAKGTPTPKLQQEYAEYLKNNYTPTDYQWGSTPPLASRDNPEVLNKMLQGAPKDLNGRTTLDCEGTSYLTGAIFGKNPRFEVLYATGGSHITATVFDKGKVSGFTADSSRAQLVSENKTPAEALWKRDRVPVERQQEWAAKGNWGEKGNGSNAYRKLGDTE